MSTPIAPSIGDEQLADIERFLSFGGSMLKVKSDALRGLIARLRAAETDAKRYRYLRDESTAPGFLCNNDRAAEYVNEYMACGEAMDKLIDSEMESASR